MTTPHPPETTTWQVTGSTEVTRIAADGTPVRGLRITYTTGQGGSGSVFVPDNMQQIEQIRGVITQAAEHLDAVNSLTSGG